jgi:hypothetical protein
MSSKFYRFWLLNEQGLYIYDKRLSRIVIMPKVEEDSLIAEIYRDPRMDEENTTIFSKDIVSSFSRLYYQKNANDLYMLLVDELTEITEVLSEFQKWTIIREQQRNRLKGIVFCIFDDVEGPKVVYNSVLEEDTAILLAVQGQTVTSMGRMNEFKTGFKEPLNVPNRDDLLHLSYDFLQSAPESTDPRIAKMGRVSNLYLLFSRDFPHVKENLFREFIESFLDEWVYTWESLNGSDQRYSSKIFDELLEDLRSTVSVAIDLTTHDEREIAKLKELIMDLLAQKKVLEYSNRRLRERIKELEK